MATAKHDVEYRESRRVVVDVVSDPVVVLTLSQEEAKTLRQIVGRIGGPVTTRRRYLDQILSALNAVGYTYKPSDVTGYISFHDDYKETNDAVQGIPSGATAGAEPTNGWTKSGVNGGGYDPYCSIR
jgi:hypothetical protein